MTSLLNLDAAFNKELLKDINWEKIINHFCQQPILLGALVKPNLSYLHLFRETMCNEKDCRLWKYCYRGSYAFCAYYDLIWSKLLKEKYGIVWKEK